MVKHGFSVALFGCLTLSRGRGGSRERPLMLSAADPGGLGTIVNCLWKDFWRNECDGFGGCTRGVTVSTVEGANGFERC